MKRFFVVFAALIFSVVLGQPFSAGFPKIEETHVLCKNKDKENSEYSKTIFVDTNSECYVLISYLPDPKVGISQIKMIQAVSRYSQGGIVKKIVKNFQKTWSKTDGSMIVSKDRVSGYFSAIGLFTVIVTGNEIERNAKYISLTFKYAVRFSNSIEMPFEDTLSIQY